MPGAVEDVSVPPGAPLLDRDHLAVQTAGDVDLARELLELFTQQCLRLLPRLADPVLAAEARADLVHTLRGSALGVGATRLGACAAEAEHRLRRGQDAGGTLARLHVAATETLRAIAVAG